MGNQRAWLPVVLVLGVLFVDPLRLCPVQAAEEMDYIYHAPESSADLRYSYHWSILETALERTKATWGGYRLQPSLRMTEERQAYELQRATGKLTVMYLSPTPEFERRLRPIRIPVDKNPSGFFVFLIRRDSQARLDSVRTLDDLRQLTCGLGKGWVDVGIMEAQGFKIVTGSSYDGLFEMLMAKRFAVLPRSGVEIINEYETHRQEMPDLHIEQNLLLAYPLPMYFWFARTPEGKRLADRAEEGMRAMLRDGTYDQIFEQRFRKDIERLRLSQRRLLSLQNPNLGPETPFSDRRLWFDPRSSK